ncbi:MAG: hypothetical protein RLZZ627_345 [Pseudomonadota bacterium]
MPETKSFTLIQNDEEFHQLCTELSGIEFLAIDTEFVRESTYYPRFCLLQVASPLGIFCIDPLSLKSLAPLGMLLDLSDSCFVLHSARQDLEVLLQSTHRLPTHMLDTQIAAGLAGYHEQIGYAALVDEITHTKLSKEQTRTDWSQRPLTSAQLHYAADDVIYLNQIFVALREKLDALGRTEWWEEDSSALLSPRFYDPPTADAWKKVRGLLDLPPQTLARALTIAEWREEAAQSLDIPRSWVLRDEALLHWAEVGELPSEALRMRNTPRHTQQEKAEDLARRLGTGGPMELAVELSQSSKGKIDPARKNLIKRLSEKNQLCANDLGISASVLATRKDLETLIDQPERCRLTQGWRQKVIGDDLQNMVASG